jgi:hypothetical protein
MKDKDNQQQTVSDFEIGWITGILEGEGSICLQIHKRNDRSQQLRVTPKIIFTNSDKQMMEHIISILSRLNVGKWVNHTKPNNISTLFKLNGKETPKFKDMMYIHISGMKRVKKLLEVITPCMAGEKKQRAILLDRFISCRFKKAKIFNCAHNYMYDQEDVGNMLEFLKLTNTPNYNKIAGMLNEYTQGKCYTRRLKMYSELTENRKKQTEMLARL